MNKRILALLFGGVIAASTSTVLAQTGGPLTPPGIPGNPATVMPSLTEIYNVAKEARTVIPPQTATYTISQSGNYVLGGDISVSSGNGITIDASDVTIDLNGFSIRSTAVPRAGYGVSIPQTSKNVVIRNGSIKGDLALGIGFEAGIFGYMNSVLENRTFVFEDLRLEQSLIYVGASPSLSQKPRVVARRISSSGCDIRFAVEAPPFTGFGTVTDCQVANIKAHHVVNSSAAGSIEAVVSVGSAQNSP